MSDPVDVRHHVWESLVSMLRVYSHAASLHGSAYEVTAGAESACNRGHAELHELDS